MATYPDPRDSAQAASNARPGVFFADSAPKDIVFAPAIDSNNGKYLMIVGQQGPIGRQDGIYHGQIISMIQGINTSLVRFAQSGNDIGRIGDRPPHKFRNGLLPVSDDGLAILDRTILLKHQVTHSKNQTT
jgi:hypothetical protein